MENSRLSKVSDCRIINLKQINNRAGNITPVENSLDIPFDVKRVYYLYDIPGGATRAAHGHKELSQLVIAVSGSFDITINDGDNVIDYQLNRSYNGLYIRPGIWRDLCNFSSGAICLVLASEYYNEDDYLRDFNEFLKFKKS